MILEVIGTILFKFGLLVQNFGCSLAGCTLGFLGKSDDNTMMLCGKRHPDKNLMLMSWSIKLDQYNRDAIRNKIL